MAIVVSMKQPTPLYRLVEDRLDGSLAEYVAQRRATTSWRTMAADLTAQTGVHVTYETLRGWFAHRIRTTVTTVTVDAAGAA